MTGKMARAAGAGKRTLPTRRRSNGGNVVALAGGALAYPVSRVWAGYWQRSV